MLFMVLVFYWCILSELFMMLMMCRLVVVVLLSSEAAGLGSVDNVDEHIGIIVPWSGTVETDGSSMGSSFMIAMKRYNYNVPFAVMPLCCDEHLSVIAQVGYKCSISFNTPSMSSNVNISSITCRLICISQKQVNIWLWNFERLFVIFSVDSSFWQYKVYADNGEG